MDIFINSGKVDFTIESEHNVGEILGSIEQECEKEGMTITGISVDGKEIPADKLDALFARAIDSVMRIDLATINGEDVLGMLRDLGKRFGDRVGPLRDIPVQLQTGKDLAVMETINGFSCDLQSLYQVLPLIPITKLPPEGPEIDGVTLAAYPTELTPLLSDLLGALKAKDTVLVGDLSE
ncbi:MAG TPA: hypothetical protein PKO22_12830, partial [Treponemataceae bacterium]|nr:hypothetical protein [Treponemataceae bacterium]